MKLVKITTVYPSYIKNFYAKHPEMLGKSYQEQKTAVDYDAFGWADFWSNALDFLGYQVWEITLNAEPLQRAWIAEAGFSDGPSINLNHIVLEQVKSYKPDVLWYDHLDQNLLKQLRDEVPSIRLVLGWVGSAVPNTRIWQDIDLTLSCAPESVERLRKAGARAEHLHHGFDPRINHRLKDCPPGIDLTFVGQIIRGTEFHLNRERILEELCSEIDINILSPSADVTSLDDIKSLVRLLVYNSFRLLGRLGFSQETLFGVPKIGRAALWTEKPTRPVNPKLRPYMKTGVFGLEMFQVLKSSKTTLNIHADSSPKYASNMRLFEATGVGTCLITDWRPNIGLLFEPDKEVITYRSAEECIEKVKWLMDNPAEREAIAHAGQVRTLKDHTFHNRAVILDEIIRRELKK